MGGAGPITAYRGDTLGVGGENLDLCHRKVYKIDMAVFSAVTWRILCLRDPRVRPKHGARQVIVARRVVSDQCVVGS